MKLYTRKGDDGETSLVGGSRVGKDDPRVEAYGGVDEANAAIGAVIAACGEEEMADTLQRIQSDLFVLGAELASHPEKRPKLTIGDGHVTQLERWIDEASEDVPPLRNFVLPGGSETAARLHLARTVCRRAERAAVALARRQPVGTSAIAYLNRLSDLMFALARRANHLAGVAETLWVAPET